MDQIFACQNAINLIYGTFCDFSGPPNPPGIFSQKSGNFLTFSLSSCKISGKTDKSILRSCVVNGQMDG